LVSRCIVNRFLAEHAESAEICRREFPRASALRSPRALRETSYMER
jgi:hypothetical protein